MKTTNLSNSDIKDFIRSRFFNEILDIINESNGLHSYLTQCSKCYDHLREKLNDIYQNTLLGPLYGNGVIADNLLGFIEKRETKKLYKTYSKELASSFKNNQILGDNLQNFVMSLYGDIVRESLQVYRCFEERPNDKSLELDCIIYKNALDKLLYDYENKKYCEYDIQFNNFNINYDSANNKNSDEQELEK